MSCEYNYTDFFIFVKSAIFINSRQDGRKENGESKRGAAPLSFSSPSPDRRGGHRG
jgi:hypothetical protein